MAVLHRCNSPSDQYQEPALDNVGGQELVSNVVLALTSAAVDHGNLAGIGVAACSSTEATGHAHSRRRPRHWGSRAECRGSTPGTYTRAARVQVHEFWKDVYTVEVSLDDLTLNQTFARGTYA